MIWAFQTATLSQSIFSLTFHSPSSLWHIVKNMCLTTRERERERTNAHVTVLSQTPLSLTPAFDVAQSFPTSMLPSSPPLANSALSFSRAFTYSAVSSRGTGGSPSSYTSTSGFPTSCPPGPHRSPHPASPPETAGDSICKEWWWWR